MTLPYTSALLTERTRWTLGCEAGLQHVEGALGVGPERGQRCRPRPAHVAPPGQVVDGVGPHLLHEAGEGRRDRAGRARSVGRCRRPRRRRPRGGPRGGIRRSRQRRSRVISSGDCHPCPIVPLRGRDRTRGSLGARVQPVVRGAGRARPADRRCRPSRTGRSDHVPARAGARPDRRRRAPGRWPRRAHPRHQAPRAARRRRRPRAPHPRRWRRQACRWPWRRAAAARIPRRRTGTPSPPLPAAGPPVARRTPSRAARSGRGPGWQRWHR